MNIGLKILLILWVLSRLTDIFSCIILGNKLQAITVSSRHVVTYRMFYALALDAAVTCLIIVLLCPYLVLGWDIPNIWMLMWGSLAAVLSTATKTYTKFKLALIVIKGN